MQLAHLKTHAHVTYRVKHRDVEAGGRERDSLCLLVGVEKRWIMAN